MPISWTIQRYIFLLNRRSKLKLIYSCFALFLCFLTVLRSRLAKLLLKHHADTKRAGKANLSPLINNMLQMEAVP